MKKQIVLIVAIIFSSLFSYAQSQKDLNIINAQDTVVFDISQTDTTSGYVEFPVYFLSDDTVNALDFSFKYNETNFSFDTIIKLAGYLTVASNYDIPSSTVFFTSYSLQNIANNTPLVKIRFTKLLPGKFCNDDLNNILVYLNGDACSVKSVECTPTVNGIHESENENASFDFYPNPSDGKTVLKINLEDNSPVDINIYDLSGKIIWSHREEVMQKGVNNIQINNAIASGVYLTKIITPYQTGTLKLIINK